MRRSSLCLTVLLVGGVPLTAAAVDYGPNAPLLAADSNAPQLPGSQMGTAARGEMPKPDVMTDEDGGGDSIPAQQRMTPSTSSPRSVVSARNPGPAARNKPPASSAHAAPPTPPTAAWQSLLPGSIQ